MTYEVYKGQTQTMQYREGFGVCPRLVSNSIVATQGANYTSAYLFILNLYDAGATSAQSPTNSRTVSFNSSMYCYPPNIPLPALDTTCNLASVTAVPKSYILDEGYFYDASDGLPHINIPVTKNSKIKLCVSGFKPHLYTAFVKNNQHNSVKYVENTCVLEALPSDGTYYTMACNVFAEQSLGSDAYFITIHWQIFCEQP